MRKVYTIWVQFDDNKDDIVFKYNTQKQLERALAKIEKTYKQTADRITTYSALEFS